MNPIWLVVLHSFQTAGDKTPPRFNETYGFSIGHCFDGIDPLGAIELDTAGRWIWTLPNSGMAKYHPQPVFSALDFWRTSSFVLGFPQKILYPFPTQKSWLPFGGTELPKQLFHCLDLFVWSFFYGFYHGKSPWKTKNSENMFVIFSNHRKSSQI